MNSDGDFVSRVDHALPRGEFLVGSFLSDTQRRRQEVYRLLWETKGKVSVAKRPTLFIWANPIDLGFRVADEATSVGSALLSIPLQLQQTAPNTTVRIPPPFLPYQKINDPDGKSVNSCFNNQSRRWIEKTGPSRNWLRFQLPKTVLPMTLDSFTIRVHFEGRSQKLEVRAFVNGKSEVIASEDKPAGEVKFQIKRKDILKLDADGGVVFGIFVGDTDAKPAAVGETKRGVSWKIDYVQADAAGTTNDSP